MILLSLEHENKCEFIKILHLIMNSEEYQLNRKYIDKFCSTCKLAARIMIICQKMGLLFIYIIILIFITIAYCEMNYSIIIMLIWNVIIFVSWFYAISVFFIASVYAYLISLYLKYRFQQVQDLIEIYLKRGNIF